MYIVAQPRRRKERVRERDNKIPMACRSNESQGKKKRGRRPVSERLEKKRNSTLFRFTATNGRLLISLENDKETERGKKNF